MRDQDLMVLLGLGALAAWGLTRQSEETAQTIAGGGGAAPYSGGGSEPYYFDPMTGQPLAGASETGTGTPFTTRETAPGTPSFSPEFEDALLQQNNALARDLAGEARRQTGAANLQTALVAAGTAALAVPTIIRVASKTPGLMRAASALRPAARVAGPVGAGLALGVGGVAVLQKTGALDHVQRAGTATLGRLPRGVQTAIKTSSLGLSIPGAVVTAATGRGTIRGNLRDAVRGTIWRRKS